MRFFTSHVVYCPYRNLTSSERRSLHVEDSAKGTCLVAVARLQHFGDDGPKVAMESNENEFVTRVAVDGRFSYVDPRYLSMYMYAIATIRKAVLMPKI